MIMMSAPHELRWAYTPQSVAKYTPWGWRSCCTCGWEQEDGGLLGKKHVSVRAWKAHRDTLSDESNPVADWEIGMADTMAEVQRRFG